MLTLINLKSWYKAAPAPIAWLLMAAILFVWLVIISSLFSMLNGGFDQLATDLPRYARNTGLKLFGIYSIAVVVYLIVRFFGRKNPP